MRVICQHRFGVVLIIFFLILHAYSQKPKINNDEPERAKITKIQILGIRLFDQSKIRGLLSTEIGQTYHAEQLEADISQILQFYQQKGYGWTNITVNVKPVESSESATKAVLELEIDEIKTVQVGQINIVGNQRFDQAELQSILSLSGDLTRKHFEKAMDRLLQFYSEYGYPKVEIRLKRLQISPVEKGTKQRTLDCHLVIEEGDRIYFGQLEIRGLKKTKFSILERELPIKSGQLFDQRKIDQSIHYLENLGYFNQVQYHLIDQKKNNHISFNANVVEGKTGRLSGVIGLAPTSESETDRPSDPVRFTGMIEAIDNNLFGTGRKVKFQWKSGLTSRIEIRYEEPWLLQRPISIGLSYRKIALSPNINESNLVPNHLEDTVRFQQPNSADIDRELFSSWEGSNIISTIDEQMASVYLKTRFRYYFESQFKLSYKRIFIPNLQQKTTQNTRNKYALTVSFLRDTRNSHQAPSTGLLAQVAFESSKGDLNFYKGWIDLERFLSLWPNQVLAVGGHLAMAWGKDLIQLYSIPTERFFLGGAKTLRGYEEDWFSGLSRLHTNFEYRYHLGSRSRLYVFLDCGMVAKKNWQFDTVKIGYGPGLSLESQNGIIFKIDYGLEPNGTLTTGKLHLNLGAAF